MALENINCPQFVDFTSDEPFNINDGADYCFEKQVVGEGIDLGGFNPFKRHSEGANVLTNATNFKHNETHIHHASSNKELAETTNNKPIIKQYTIVENNKQVISKIDKENEVVNINKIVGETKTTVSSAIELISVTTTTSKIANNENGKGVKVQTTTTTTSSCRTATASTLSSSNKQKPRPRNHSVASTTSNTSSNNNLSNNNANTKTNKLPVSSNSNNNIVKKTLAKMTAAFKTSTKSSQVAPVSSINTLKKKLTSSKKAQPGAGPIKVEHHSRAMAPFDELTNRAQSPTSNRRCSSVPRTLKEKQALNRAGIIELDGLEEANAETDAVVAAPSGSVKLPTLTTTLSDKIQNFFNSHTSNYASATKSSINKSNLLSNLKNKQPILANKSNLNASKTNTNANKLNQSKPKASINDSTLSSGYNRHRSRSIEEHAKARLNNKQVPIQHNSRSRNATGDSVEIKTNKPFFNNSTKLNNYKPTIATSPNLLTQNLKSRQKSADRAAPAHPPMYTGVKFIPKLSHKYQFNSAEGYNNINGTHILPNLAGKHEQTSSNPIISNNKLPIGGIAASSLMRSASGKSASFNKQQKPNSLVSTLCTTQTKINSIQIKNHVTSSSSNDNINGLNLESNRTNRTINLNESTASSNNPNNLSRKKSDNKPVGQLHTEMRAQRRNEYDQTLKEKERIAVLIKKDLELEKMRKQHEEIQKIRMQRAIRAKPTKSAIKPVEAKGDENHINEPTNSHLSNQMKSLNLSHDNIKLDY